MKRHALRTLSILSLLLFSQALFSQNECECTNCPVPIFDNGTYQGFLEVSLDGPNDLAQCPLEKLCFEITHTWVGDLSVTLTSPGGVNYMVMADFNNDFGGCGNENENIDICIVPGTDNPITNNTEYMCNGGAFNCLNGDWTMPCGGVTDPVTFAEQAPTCNLTDFNVAGQPTNGTWILTVNDICFADEGFLDTWSLTFGCAVAACFSCDTDGGALDTPPVVACEGDSELDLNIPPQYVSAQPPNPVTTDYTYIISQNGTIIDVTMDTDLTGFMIGEYEICGLSYANRKFGRF